MPPSDQPVQHWGRAFMSVAFGFVSAFVLATGAHNVDGLYAKLTRGRPVAAVEPSVLRPLSEVLSSGWWWVVVLLMAIGLSLLYFRMMKRILK